MVLTAWALPSAIRSTPRGSPKYRPPVNSRTTMRSVPSTTERRRGGGAGRGPPLVRHVVPFGAADCPEEDGPARLAEPERDVRQRVTRLVDGGAAHQALLELEAHAGALRYDLEDLERLGGPLLADPVAGQHRDPMGSHIRGGGYAPLPTPRPSPFFFATYFISPPAAMISRANSGSGWAW